VLQLVRVFLIATVMILVLSTFNVDFPLVQAQTVIPTTAYVNVGPNPIGVGQTVNVTMLIEPPPPSPPGYFSKLAIYFTDPDNATEYRGDIFSDQNGSASTTYTPDQIGTWELQLKYPGESFEEGNIVYESSTSAIVTLNVTAEPQPTPTPSPTPEPTPDPTATPEPTPTPSPSPTPTPQPTPTPSPTASATPEPTSTPELAELPSWIILPLLIVATMVAIVYFKKHKH
jgi:hypothetical protein